MRKTVQNYKTIEACNKRQANIRKLGADLKAELKEIELRKEQIRVEGETQLSILPKWVNK